MLNYNRFQLSEKFILEGHIRSGNEDYVGVIIMLLCKADDFLSISKNFSRVYAIRSSPSFLRLPK